MIDEWSSEVTQALQRPLPDVFSGTCAEKRERVCESTLLALKVLSTENEQALTSPA